MRDKFEGGVMGSDGCIYCIPLSLESTWGGHEARTFQFILVIKIKIISYTLLITQ